MIAVKRQGLQTIQFGAPPHIIAASTIVGPREGEGPLAASFDTVVPSDLYGEKTPEKAEYRLLEEACQGALVKANLTADSIQYYLGGDLLNQIVTSSFVARQLQIPYLGLYAACATIGQGLALGGMIIDGGFADKVLVGAASHYHTAERQFRYPVELNIQHRGTNQTTVTGAGAAILANVGPGPRLTRVTWGKVIDYGLKDANDLGSAMAPAAADTLVRHFQDTGTTSGDYDLILTGDLARMGSKMFHKLLQDAGYVLGGKHQDAGLLIFSPQQKAGAGGSGAGCIASVLMGHVLKEMHQGRYHKILILPTGALFSPLTCQQGESIPCISHALVIEEG